MKVKFLPQGIEIPISPEKTLLQAALENGIDVKSICKGKLICAECRVKVVEGENSLVPPSKAELNLLGTSYQLDGRRFACQVRCFGDATFDLTEQVQRAESARKNIRGFKSSKPVTESQAVLDTMLLNEKIEVTDEGRAPRHGHRNEPRPGVSGEGEAGKAEHGNRSQKGGRGQQRPPPQANGDSRAASEGGEAMAADGQPAQGQGQGEGQGQKSGRSRRGRRGGRGRNPNNPREP